MQTPEFTRPLAGVPDQQSWPVPAASEIMRATLPHLGLGDRLLLRAVALLARYQIVSIHGLQHVRAACDPFILAINHGTRRESLLVPALLLLHRGGRPLHFLADWNFRLIPGVGLTYSRAQVVTVLRLVPGLRGGATRRRVAHAVRSTAPAVCGVRPQASRSARRR